jgi:hypothetical protein
MSLSRRRLSPLPLLARVTAASFVLAVASFPTAASAGEIQASTGPGVYGSSWRGDATFGEALRLGYRFADIVAIDFVGRLGYGTVDDRVLTYLSVGGTLYGRLWKLRPYVRGAFVHQHEESTPSVKDDPFGALFGVGDGIRHRGGFGSSLGVDIPLRKSGAWEFVMGVDTSGVYFPDPRGPKLYAGGGLWLGVNWGL